MLEEKYRMIKKNLLAIVGFLLFFISCGINIFLVRQLQIKNTNEEIKVLAVLDGDTIVLEGKTRLRLRSIDAPELEFCGGQEAKRELEKLVASGKITFTEQIIDQRGRPMALV